MRLIHCTKTVHGRPGITMTKTTGKGPDLPGSTNHALPTRKGKRPRTLKSYDVGGLGVTEGSVASAKGAARQQYKAEAHYEIIVRWFLRHPGLYIAPKRLNLIINPPTALERHGGNVVHVVKRMSDLKNWGVLRPNPLTPKSEKDEGEPLGLALDWKTKLNERKPDQENRQWSILRKKAKLASSDRKLEVLEAAIAALDAPVVS